MTAFAVGLILVPVADQAVKRFMRRQVGRRSISLGRLGQVRVMHTQIWMRRAFRPTSPQVMWGMWIAAAGASLAIATVFPGFGWAFGLLLGAALSHALETSFRESVCDYVCLRFWPAFNLADVALTVGAIGVAVELFAVV